MVLGIVQDDNTGTGISKTVLFDVPDSSTTCVIMMMIFMIMDVISLIVSPVSGLWRVVCYTPGALRINPSFLSINICSVSLWCRIQP